jgi:hypothetical protein
VPQGDGLVGRIGVALLPRPGSFYERMGAARAWLLREDEQERLDQARYDRERND